MENNNYDDIEIEISSYACVCCSKKIPNENFGKYKGLFCSRLCREEYEELGSFLSEDILAEVG